jgi:hypothetical protein
MLIVSYWARVLKVFSVIRDSSYNVNAKVIGCSTDNCAMAQEVSRRPLTAEAQVWVRLSPCGIMLSSVNITSPWSHTHIYHVGDEQ